MNEGASKGGADTNLGEFFEELGGGVFAQKALRALSEVSLGVINYGDKGKSGKVTVTFDIKRIGESNQVALGHSLSYSRPTKRGKASEEDRTETPMYVGREGRLTLIPDTQIALFEDRQR